MSSISHNNVVVTKLEGEHHQLAPSMYFCFYNTLIMRSTFGVDIIIFDMML
jgi:hypothetical protein